ncbi:translation elongation factor Ts [Vallitaleaceae bacterium 9-2]
MAVTAALVKELRERTGAGMLDCKKALTETDGNIEQAIEVLREKGLAKAAKKAGRVAAEGMVAAKVSDDHKSAVLVEVNSETDFVAKNEKFQVYVGQVADQAMKTTAADIDAFLAEQWIADESKTVQDELNAQIAVIGEKLSIRRFEKVTIDNGVVASYIHAGGKIGVLVEAATDVVNDDVQEALRNVAMQIAALPPVYLSRDEVDADYIESEKNILKQQAINENPDKPENIIDKMIIGRLNKQLKEVCLLDQTYVKDSDLTVQKYIDQVGKNAGTSITLKSYVRFETGEGIEKKEENFAEEVAKQMQQ